MSRLVLLVASLALAGESRIENRESRADRSPLDPPRGDARGTPPAAIRDARFAIQEWDFAGLTWVDGEPDLKGKVVLVRWWTNNCSLCSTSAPALAELSKKAAVVAVYHPKPVRDVAPEDVRAWAKKIGMPGALAVDRDWKVLDRWMAPGKREFTSLTFVLDRKGKVRHVHRGGVIEPEDAKELSQQIDALLAEK